MALVAFDLDDTLFKEIDFLHSAWRHIASLLSAKYGIERNLILQIMHQSQEAFESLNTYLHKNFGDIEENIGWMVSVYRNHQPDITLSPENKSLIESLIKRRHILALVTDGRISTQTNKVRALGLDRYINEDNIFISEKTGDDKIGGTAFRILDKRYLYISKYYIGDNPMKDFYWPRKLGWTTVMLVGDKHNIHPQTLPADQSFHPLYKIDHLSQLNNILT